MERSQGLVAARVGKNLSQSLEAEVIRWERLPSGEQRFAAAFRSLTPDYIPLKKRHLLLDVLSSTNLWRSLMQWWRSPISLCRSKAPFRNESTSA